MKFMVITHHESGVIEADEMDDAVYKAWEYYGRGSIVGIISIPEESE